MIRKLTFSTLALLLSGAAGTMSYAADISVPEIEIEDTSSAYFAARIGRSFAEDSEFDLNNAAVVPTSIENDYNDGYIGALAIGYDFGAGVRGEIEVNYNEHDVKTHTVTALATTFPEVSSFGDTRAIVGLANGYLDINVGSTLVPYVSGGIGIAHVEFDSHGIVLPPAGAAGLPPGAVTALSDEGTAFAWQLGGGVSIDLGGNSAFEVGYRYQSIENVSLTAVDGTESDVDFETQNIIAGIRFGF